MRPTSNPVAVIALAMKLSESGRVSEAVLRPRAILEENHVAGVDPNKFAVFVERYAESPLHGLLLPGRGPGQWGRDFVRSFVALHREAGRELDIYFDAADPLIALRPDAEHPLVLGNPLQEYVRDRSSDQLIVWPDRVKDAESLAFNRHDLASLPQAVGVLIETFQTSHDLRRSVAAASAVALQPVPEPPRKSIDAWVREVRRECNDGKDFAAVLRLLEELQAEGDPAKSRVTVGRIVAVVAATGLAYLGNAVAAEIADWVQREVIASVAAEIGATSSSGAEGDTLQTPRLSPGPA